MPQLSNRVAHFTESVIRRMTRVAQEHNAVNLSQGFPDFDPPELLLKNSSGICIARAASICNNLGFYCHTERIGNQTQPVFGHACLSG